MYRRKDIKKQKSAIKRKLSSTVEMIYDNFHYEKEGDLVKIPNSDLDFASAELDKAWEEYVMQAEEDGRKILSEFWNRHENETIDEEEKKRGLIFTEGPDKNYIYFRTV